MDHHLNLFQSYNSGNQKDIDRIVQLEDNITRALLCTVSNLEDDLQIKFLNSLSEKVSIRKNESFDYDLQNLSKDIDQSKIKNKILVTIQRYSNDVSKRDLIFDERIVQFLDNEFGAKEKVFG